MAQYGFCRVSAHGFFVLSLHTACAETHFHVQSFRPDGIQGADGNNPAPAPDAMRRAARVLFHKN